MATIEPKPNGSTPVDPADDAPIKEKLRTLYQAIESADADGMLHLLSDDFELLEPERKDPIQWDRGKFVDVVRSMAGAGKIEYELDQFYIEHDGEFAYSGYRNRFKFRSPQRNVDETTLEMAVLAFRDGEWVIEKIRAWLVDDGSHQKTAPETSPRAPDETRPYGWEPA